MRLHKNGVVKMRDRLIKRKLLKKNIKGHLKTEVAYHSVYRLDKDTYHSVTKRTTQCVDTVPLSSTKNNKEINIEIEDKSLAEVAKNRIRERLGIA